MAFNHGIGGLDSITGVGSSDFFENASAASKGQQPAASPLIGRRSGHPRPAFMLGTSATPLRWKTEVRTDVICGFARKTVNRLQRLTPLY